jgi:hypothetical protein
MELRLFIEPQQGASYADQLAIVRKADRTSAVRRHIRWFRRVSGLVRGLRGSGIGEIV